MAITVRKVESRYEAQVTPPDGEAWSSDTPMSSARLIEALKARGGHQTDIGDAFYEADPDWLVDE